MNLSGELAFLNDVFSRQEDEYRHAYWLKSNFSDDTWKCEFNDGKDFVISFRVKLYDGHFLTSPKHQKLLDIFKTWLCIQSNPAVTSGTTAKSITVRHRMAKVMHFIDYLLINGSHYKLCEHGIALLTKNDLMGILLKISSHRFIYESIYEWTFTLEKFLKEKMLSITPAEQNKALIQFPFLQQNIPEMDERKFNFTEEEIISARVWLWLNSYYREHSDVAHKYSLKTSRLCAEIYCNTLFGWTNKLIPAELLLVPIIRYRIEHQRVPLRSKHNSKKRSRPMNTYYSVLRSLGLLSTVSTTIPIKALAGLSPGWSGALTEGKDGRFKTLPIDVTMTGLKNAIEYSLEFGDAIIDSYISLCKHVHVQGTTCFIYSNRNCIEQHLDSKLKELGICRWTIDIAQLHSTSENQRCTKGDYFHAFRNSPGLYEALRVLYGCVQICVGVLMARRNGELLELLSGNCLDVEGKYLLFKNRKSGVLDERELEARPIPTVAVKMIRQLERLQNELIALNILNEPLPLFSYPCKILNTPILRASPKSLEGSLDFFCDYFETAKDDLGRRYYIRQHQLRRSFAMLFFWNNSFGGMDTLRWFLSHTDSEHLYNYITESVPGEVLLSVKAQYGREQLKAQSPESLALAALVNEHFGTKHFSVLDDDELEEYIEELIREKMVCIEPHFFRTPAGSHHRISISVSNGRGGIKL